MRGARDVCECVGGSYVGGDLDEHQEFTVASTAIGRADGPVFRSGARPGDVVCVTGTFGRSAAALELFERAGDASGRDRADALDRANALFRFEPRVAAGRTLAGSATAMMDSSDGLARSLHQLAEASDCGFAIDADRIPIADALADVVDSDAVLDLATTFGEDFELVVTLPEADLEAARAATDVQLSRIGTVVARDDGITLDGEPLADRGYTHG